MPEPDTRSRPGLSRRRLLGTGAVALGAAGTGWGAASVKRSSTAAARAGTTGQQTVAFYGDHQAGVTTPAQAHAVFAAYDLAPGTDRQRVAGLLRAWTDDAARLTQGIPGLADSEAELATSPSRLTITVGFGPRLFDVIGAPHLRPPGIAQLPAYRIDELDPGFTGGDLLLQVCADDPLPLAHALRILSRSVRSLVTPRWVQRGFRDARGSQPEGTTMRNLMGQLDGTANPKPEDAGFGRLVWSDGAQAPWFRGGTQLVLRRIRMDLDTWDELGRDARELSVGRRIANGAPLTGNEEHDEPDFAASDRFGLPVIPPSSHIARAHPQHPSEVFFRRAYNYDDPPSGGAISNTGLLFAAYQADITTQFLPVQERLAEFDVLNEWTTPVGSAVFAIPPGCQPGQYLGQQLFDSV
ncbi:Dyp-type peroxidase [Hoyosella sp. YIM 151337]|uniref:Dyp-type peroxidase n=1 Tax=Hoyosella sp. YIM 151337 TaxID=2992742 RepID=UPI00223569B7|nr:Dyp-type peroxidase [Hoyosella sp. YIM 151337]MCW4352542.1 Dyp-type peroxidase [Hoyosella sp. YIM 151337]